MYTSIGNRGARDLVTYPYHGVSLAFLSQDHEAVKNNLKSIGEGGAKQQIFTG